MIMSNQNMAKMQNFVSWIQAAFLIMFKDIEADVETRFDASNFELDRTLQEKIKK